MLNQRLHVGEERFARRRRQPPVKRNPEQRRVDLPAPDLIVRHDAPEAWDAGKAPKVGDPGLDAFADRHEAVGHRVKFGAKVLVEARQIKQRPDVRGRKFWSHRRIANIHQHPVTTGTKQRANQGHSMQGGRRGGPK